MPCGGCRHAEVSTRGSAGLWGVSSRRERDLVLQELLFLQVFLEAMAACGSGSRRKRCSGNGASPSAGHRSRARGSREGATRDAARARRRPERPRDGNQRRDNQNLVD